MESLIAVAVLIGLVTLFAMIIGVGVFGCYMLWKMLSVIRHMEFSEAYRRQDGMVPVTTGANLSNEHKDGGFQGYNEIDAYINETANRVAVSSEVSDEEAVNILMAKMREQGLGNSADV